MICFFFGKEDMLEASLKNPHSELMEGDSQICLLGVMAGKK